MKKALKITKYVLLGILAAFLLFLFVVFTYNGIMVLREKDLLENQQISQTVEVDGHHMSVYVSGNGLHTLVFLSGSGDPSPVLGFKPFAEHFENECRIAIIEKFGYGFSDEYEGSRDVETRVRQNREALKAAGAEEPYILCPHSYSGLEAIYWAQNYPEEVEAIAGLDMAVPASYESYDEKTISQVHSTIKLKRFLRKLGIIRLLAGGSDQDGVTEEEKKAELALAGGRFCNKTFERESDYLLDDIKLINDGKAADVPTLLIISDGKVTEGWIDIELEYASKLTDATTLQLDCGHTVYEYEADKCEEAIKNFIERIH